MAAAASSRSRTWEVTRAARAPRAAARGESVTVDANRATAATPSIDQATYATVTAVRQVASWAAIVWPDTDGSGLTPNSHAPTADATPATTSTARNTNTIVTASLATGRNTGSTRASAAAGNSAPLLSTWARNAGPSPGRGPTPVTRSSTATSVGS